VALRKRIALQAGTRCGYCLSGQELLGMPMTIEHLVPQAAGGAAVGENLWLSCVRCNLVQGTQTHANDPETGESGPLFDPRREVWSEHFA
jgi:5-methylcytosine-specific restriction endonuclease McrA